MTDTIREADMLLLSESAAPFSQVNVFQQPVIQFRAASEAELFADVAKWCAGNRDWSVVSVQFDVLEGKDGPLRALVLGVEPNF